MATSSRSSASDSKKKLPVTARTATPTAAYSHQIGERDSNRPRPNKSAFLLGSISDVNDKIARIEKFLYGSPSTATSSSKSSEFTGGLDFSFDFFEEDPLLPDMNKRKAKEKAELNQFAGLFAMTAAMKFRRSVTPSGASPLRADVAAGMQKGRSESTAQAPGAAKSKINQVPLYADTHKFEYRQGVILLPNGPRPEQIYSQVLLSDRRSGAIDDTETVEMMDLLHSEPCINLLLDSFWWIFVDNYGDDYTKRTSLAPLFDRVATHYLHFLQFCNTEINRHVFKIVTNRQFFILKSYPELLSKAVYCAFCNCFPDSVKQYSDAFRNCIINTIYEWICGAKPLPDTWKRWNLDMLERSILKGDTVLTERSSKPLASRTDTKRSRQSVATTPSKASVEKGVAKVPVAAELTWITEENDSEVDNVSNEDFRRERAAEREREREKEREKEREREKELEDFLDAVNKACLLRRPRQKTAMTSQSDPSKTVSLDSRKQPHRKSYPVVHGGYTNTVQFNVNARSPLLDYCIRTKKVTMPDAGMDLLVHRAEARYLPNELEMFTYKDVISTVRESTKKIRDEHVQKRSIDEAERLRFLASVKENVAHRDEQMRMLLGNQKEVQRLCNLIMVERKRNDPSEIAAGLSADEQIEIALRRQRPRTEF